MDKRRTTATAKKVDKLLNVLSDKKKILIISHDNPDPDTLASGLGLRDIIQRKLEARATIGYTGIVGRAENRALIKHLNIPLRHLDTLNLSEYDATILVDSQQRNTHLELPGFTKPTAIIDHHPMRPETRKVRFHDVRSKIGATSTIITLYHIAKDFEMDTRVATALLYGIKSDTRDLGRETSKEDLEAYLYLYPHANLRLLSKIEFPDLSPDYFKVYDHAIENAVSYDGVIVSFIGDIGNPDMVAEMADTLVRLEGTNCALVGGYYNEHIFLSIRTKDSIVNAGKLVGRVIGKLGPCGGHGSMSAGRIKLESATNKEKSAIEKLIVARLKRAMKIRGARPSKLLR